MSVEKMEMMNVIGYLDDLDRVSMEIIRQGCVHIVNALNEINQNNFTVMTPNQNTNVLMDLCFVKPYNKTSDFLATTDKLAEMMDLFGLDKCVKKKYVNRDFDYHGLQDKVDYVYNEVKQRLSNLEAVKRDLSRIEEFQGYMKHIRGVKINFNILRSMNFFNFKIGKLSRENYDKMKDNIENISSIIYEITSIQGGQVILSLTPKVLQTEVDRIMASLNFEEIKIPYEFGGTPDDIINNLGEKIKEKQDEIRKYNDEIVGLGNKYLSFIDESYSMVKMLEKVQSINNEVACTNDFFYMAGWVPVSEVKKLQKGLSKFGDRLILIFKPQSEVNSRITPPTRLKNNWVVRPFESLVRMYGIPSYNEFDPTTFVAISYMIMFGSMFGDLGQGFIFFLAGLILSLKGRRPNLGGLFSRLGISSMIFGVLFGSVFGEEGIIKPLLFHPMENIYTVLIGGVVLGIGFTTVGFIYSLLNAIKRRDLEEGVFGKDGLVGFMFYWIILLTALSIYNNGGTKVPTSAIILVLSILVCLMVLKKPISNIIRGRKPLYDEAVGDYYIESGFGILETLLSMLSNTISFIRVGAFALNHVGLFIAFATIANMMKSDAGSIAMMVLGNIIVICLEGMVVFIQGLRLEYYELFSKYYEGSGIEYNPVKLSFRGKSDSLSPVVNINYITDTGHSASQSILR